MKYEFFDKRTERLYKKLLSNDKFKKYFSDISDQESFYNTNAIPENSTISLVAFQAIEFYLKYNKKQTRKIFYKFSKLAAGNDRGKLKHLVNQTNKIIDEMNNNKYIFSTNTMLDFLFEINTEIIKSIKIYLKTIGDGIYRIGYNIYLQDEYYLKYWLLVTNDMPNLLKITRIPFLNKGKISFVGGNERKSKELKYFIKITRKEIYKTIRNIAPGIFISLYKTIPIIMVLEIDRLEYYVKLNNQIFKFHNQEKKLNSSFWEIVRNDEINSGYDFYYNRNYFDLYIPSKTNDPLQFTIFSKHFRNKSFVPTNLLFTLEILNKFYKMQSAISDDLKSRYLFKTINAKFMLFFRERKQAYKIDALIKLLEESYKIEERDFTNPYDKNLRYYLNNSYEFENEYFEQLTKNITCFSEKIKSNMPELKDIYDKVQNDKNNGINISLQIIMLVLTIVMAIQTFQQCSTEKNIEQNIKSDTILNNRARHITEL